MNQEVVDCVGVVSTVVAGDKRVVIEGLFPVSDGVLGDDRAFLDYLCEIMEAVEDLGVAIPQLYVNPVRYFVADVLRYFTKEKGG